MKYIKIIFSFTMFLLLAILSFSFSNLVDSELIIGYKQVVEVKENTFEKGKKDIINSMNSFSDENRINMIYAIPNYSNEEIQNDIYLFGNDDKVSSKKIVPFSPKKKNNMLSLKEFEFKDIAGKYFLEKKINPKQLSEFFYEQGLIVTIYNMDFFEIFITLLFDNGLVITFLSLLLIFLVLSFQSVIINFKEYSIKKLSGFSFRKIYLDDFFYDKIKWLICPLILYLSSITLLFIIGYREHIIFFAKTLGFVYLFSIIIMLIIDYFSYILFLLINVPEMLKDKKPYLFLSIFNNTSKVLILILLSTILIQNNKLLHELEVITNSFEIWEKMDDYYTIEIAPKQYNKKEIVELSNKLKQFALDGENNEAILFRNNNIYEPKLSDYGPEQGNVMYVNNNFLKFYDNLVDNNLVDYMFRKKTKKPIVFFPVENRSEIEKLIDRYNAWLEFNLEKEAVTFNTFEIDFLDNNLDIYSFDTRTEKKFSFLKNPAIIVLNIEDMDPDYIFASISQGVYLFKDIELINKSIQKNKLTNDIVGITNFKDNAQYEINELRTKMIFLKFSVLILLIVLLLLIYTNLNQYIERVNIEIFIKVIHGYNLIKIYLNYLLINLVGIYSIVVITMLLMNNLFFIRFLFVIASLEFLINICYIYYFTRVKILKKYKEVNT